MPPQLRNLLLCEVDNRPVTGNSLGEANVWFQDSLSHLLLGTDLLSPNVRVKNESLIVTMMTNMINLVTCEVKNSNHE